MKSSKAVNRRATKSKRGVPQVCRYDVMRSALLDHLRKIRERETGLPYVENRSLILHDALDALLKAEGLLEPDAPLHSEIVTKAG